MPRPDYGVVFETFRDLPTKEERVAHLHKYAKPPMFYLLWLAFHPHIKWNLPAGCPPFKPHVGRPGSEPSDLTREIRRMYMFFEAVTTRQQKLRRERIFQTILESLSPTELKVLISIKNKTFDKDYDMSRAFVKELFPLLLTPESGIQPRFFAPRT